MNFTVDSKSDKLIPAKSNVQETLGNQAEKKLSDYVNELTEKYCTQGVYFHDNTVYMPITKINPDEKDKYRNKSMIISFPYKLFSDTVADSEAKNIRAAYRLIEADKKDSYQFEVEGCSFATVGNKKRMCFCANREKNVDRDIIGYINA